MDVFRTALRPAARLAGWHAARQARDFLAAHWRTRQVQDELLRRLLAASAESDFGRDHGFQRVRTYEDFVSAVPVGDYEARRSYVQRVFEGNTRALFSPGTEVLMFAVTSGTTGQPKHIPVTRRFLDDYRRGWNVFGLRLLSDHPAGWLRKILTIVSSAREYLSPAGIPCGSISGVLAEHQKWIVRRMYPVPLAVRDMRPPAGRYYAIIRACVARDIGVVTTANPSSAVKLAEVARDHADRLIRDVHDGTFRPPVEIEGGDPSLTFRPDRASARRLEGIVARHGELLPRHFWNLAVMTHWIGGTLGLYLPRVREYYGDVPVRDIGLLASEGRMTVPLADGTPAGVAEITSNLLEFIPVEEADSPRPTVLRADEVEVGREYFIVLSNWTGLFRYNIGDCVRVTERFGQSPVLEFLSRGSHSSSITGEKLTEHQVVSAMSAAARACRLEVQTFVLQGHFAPLPYYQLSIELGEGQELQRLAERMDRELRRLNVEYDAKRASGRLGPIRPACVPPGTFARQEADQLARVGGRSEQYKHKYLLPVIVNDGDQAGPAGAVPAAGGGSTGELQ